MVTDRTGQSGPSIITMIQTIKDDMSYTMDIIVLDGHKVRNVDLNFFFL